MNGQRINRSIIRSSFVEISRMYESQKVLQKNVVFLICDNTLEAISLYCYHLVHKNIVFLIGRENFLMPGQVSIRRTSERTEKQKLSKSIRISSIYEISKKIQ